MRRIASAERRFYAERVERAGKTREEELKMRLAAAREKLAAQQLLIKEQKVPVLVLLEGWGTAGKGYCIGQIIENIDPRHFKVESMERKTGEEERKPFYTAILPGFRRRESLYF